MRLTTRLQFFPVFLLVVFFACSGPDSSDRGLGLPEKENPDIFWAVPNIIQSCEDEPGQTTLHWKVEEVKEVEVRIDAVDGKLFTRGGPRASKTTGPWVTDGMVFCLVNPENSTLLATCRVRVTRAGCPE